ncbi:hypothetical protein [Aliikangiella sp. IMCC44359]|uniref:hypothetical protein n=1 Tax=Aliikangiella sp. IMCC44359 TaxID=3459125 RepID=UPI00403AA9FA
MSAKSSLKLLLPNDAQGQLFKWVLVITGSKNTPDGKAAFNAALALLIIPVLMLIADQNSYNPAWIIVGGLLIFAIVFAINSAIHSFLILSYATQKDVSLDVGFYYMSNTAGRLVGTLLSGFVILILVFSHVFLTLRL